MTYTSVDTSSSVPNVSSTDRFIGRVKWFNNKAGYGFLTVTSEGNHFGSDIFVHHSAIKVVAEQYKYLVQGEYVEFGLINIVTGKHAIQASEVCGINGGKLMCETRYDTRVARSQNRSKDDVDRAADDYFDGVTNDVKMPKSVRVTTPKSSKPEGSRSKTVDRSSSDEKRTERKPRSRGQGPREEGEWTYIAKARKNTTKTKSSKTTEAPQTSSKENM